MKSKLVPRLLIFIGIAFLVIMLIIPLALVLFYALRQGITVFWEAICDKYTIKALQLTLGVTTIAIIFNTIFGLFAAWTISKFRFRGKQVLSTLIDIPFSISPVIVGLMIILIFGKIGWAYPFLHAHNIRVVFAVPSIIIATIFVTFPFVSHELIPLMEAQGKDEEEAAALMGAKGFRIFRKVTFPHIKWGLLYGIILCTARSLGEFGAVSVVSGNLRGKTDTLPLQVEMLFNEFNITAAFAVSSILVVFAIGMLVLRNIIENRLKRKEG